MSIDRRSRPPGRGAWRPSTPNAGWNTSPRRTKPQMPRPAPSNRAPDVAQILFLLDTAYDHASWHGPNLRGAIRGVTPPRAAWRPAPGRHNIWELVVHAAYWKYVAWRRLT